jgi:hypothetical protein
MTDFSEFLINFRRWRTLRITVCLWVKLSLLESSRTTAKYGPRFHKSAPLFEKIAATIAAFNGAANRMGKASLGYLAGEIGGLGRPIPEAAAKAVHGKAGSHRAQQFEHGHITLTLPALRAWKNEWVALKARLPIDYRDGLAYERHPVSRTRLHSFRRYRPGSAVPIHLAPARPDGFASPRSR